LELKIILKSSLLLTLCICGEKFNDLLAKLDIHHVYRFISPDFHRLNFTSAKQFSSFSRKVENRVVDKILLPIEWKTAFLRGTDRVKNYSAERG